MTFAALRSCARRFPVIAAAIASVAVFATAFSARAQASEDISIDVVIKDHKFVPSEIKIPASKPVKLTVKNLDASAEEFESHELGFEKVIPGNSTAVIRLKPVAAGNYLFFGEYHEATANGHILAE